MKFNPTKIDSMKFNPIIGIDPGLKGGIAIYHHHNNSLTDITIDTYTMPVIHPDLTGVKFEIYTEKLVEVFGKYVKHYKPHAFLEKSHAMPKQGVTGMFNYGMGYGMLRGVLSALYIPCVLVPPRQWQRVITKDCKGNTPKAKALDYVTRTYPHLNLKATVRSRTPHDGIVDAICIMDYGRLSAAIKSDEEWKKFDGENEDES